MGRPRKVPIQPPIAVEKPIESDEDGMVSIPKGAINPGPKQAAGADGWKPSLGHPTDPTHPFNKQWDIYNARERVMLVCGSRLSGKTYSCLHRICRHLFETPGARVAMFAKSKGLAKDGGSWQQLVEQIIPEWVNANIGFEMTTFTRNGEPGTKLDPLTKSAYFRVRNFYGGESECRLFSIDNENEIEQKVKNKEFSMIYFIELSMFKDPRVLAITLPSLRMRHLRPKDGSVDIYSQWLADTNPDVDDGDSSWFYKMFYLDRNKYNPGDEYERLVFESMRVIEMFHWDNPHITKLELAWLKKTCEIDPLLYDSYWLGKHGVGSKARSKVFSDLFIPNFHVIGGGDGESDQILVNKSTTTLHAGWDIGGVNHGAGIAERWLRRNKDGSICHCWSILDELVVLKEEITVTMFTQSFLEKMEELERKSARRFQWIHWADDTALNVWRPTSGTFDYLEVRNASKGKIELQGVVKPDGSVRARVRLLRRLLRENRIFISSRCSSVVDLFQNAHYGDSEKGLISPGYLKHSFDWLSYIIYMEGLEDVDYVDLKPEAGPLKEADYVSA